MCEFCAQHGEGKAWYLSMKNYSQELLSKAGRKEHITSFFQDFETSVSKSLSMLGRIQALPFVPRLASRIATMRQKSSHFGQVVPIEDVDRLLDQVTSVVRLPCVCRSFTTGRKETRYCYGLGIDPTHLIGQFPDFGQSLEWLEKEDARQAIHQLDKEGLVHSVWTFDTPFIGGLCNCDQDCIAYRLQVSTGMMQVYFPAEYTASIDWDHCSGCKLCRSQCPFGAIRYSSVNDKCSIDPASCYGCGLCRAVCKKNAVRLEPRHFQFHWQPKVSPQGNYKISIKPCADARGCRVCLDSCPSQVLGMVPQQRRTNGEPAGDWKIKAILPGRCTRCGVCLTVCPQSAITIH